MPIKYWRRRSNKNGETRWWARVHQGGGNRHWLQSSRIVTCRWERSRTFPSSRACQKKKIESHPHREALQADLQQNNVHKPFSNNSKAMIRELGNVELFELCETIPKVQCSHCLLLWTQESVYCTCGQPLVDSESRRKFNKLRLDALSSCPILSGLSRETFLHLKTKELHGKGQGGRTLLITMPASTSCLSLCSFTSCIRSWQRLSTSTNLFSCVSHLAKLAMYTSSSPCLKIWKSIWPLSFLACLAICMMEMPVSTGVSNCSFNSLSPTFTSSLSSMYFSILLAASSKAAHRFRSSSTSVPVNSTPHTSHFLVDSQHF